MQVPPSSGAHNLGAELFRLINEYLAKNGLTLKTGTIVDATLIDAPSSTKNKDGQRDPEMRQTKKANQWYFGMKGHTGVDSQSKLIHSVAAMSANVHDCRRLPALLHGNETRVWGGSAYAGQSEVIRRVAPYAQDVPNKKGQRRQPLSAAERAKNRTKSKVRAKGEHPLLVLKRIFGFRKVRYRGIQKCDTAAFTRTRTACSLPEAGQSVDEPQASATTDVGRSLRSPRKRKKTATGIPDEFGPKNNR